MIINGIDIEVTQGDLADRLLRVALPRVNGGRRAEKIIAAEWAQEWPDILGGLLTLAAAVQHRLPSVTVADLPRMADYANVLAAVDQICGTDGLGRYREQSKRVTADTLDNPFIGGLISHQYTCDGHTSAEVLAALTPADEKWKAPKGWPANARAVTGQLTRHAPALRAQGWTIDNDDGRNKLNRVQWFIRPPEKDGNPASPASPASPEGDNDWSEGLWDGESEDRQAENDDSPDSPPDSPNSPPSPDSPKNEPPTSADELASYASQEYGPSMVCQYCGTDLKLPSAAARGYCSRARCLKAHQQQTSEAK